MNFNSAFKLLASVVLIGGLIGFMTTSNNVLIHLSLFLGGLAMLMIAFTFENATNFDNWVKTWRQDGKRA